MSTTTPNAYGHPRLNELLAAAQQTPFIGQVLIGTVRDLVHPQDRILCCHYMMETSGATEDRDFTYYQIEVVLVTTAFFIRINFFPKTHTYSKKRIHTINELKLEYPAPPMDDLAELQAGEFLPVRMKLETQFANDRGAVVENWIAEASDIVPVRHLMEINRQLGRMVGLPLAQAAGQPAAAGQG
jgi:hypothetical protein